MSFNQVGAASNAAGTVIDTLQNIFLEVFTPGPPLGYWTGVLAIVIALIFGLALVREYKFGHVINMTLSALVTFAVILGLIDFFLYYFEGFQIGAWVENSFNDFLNVTFGLVLVYFIGFFLVISLAYFIGGALKKK